MGSNIVGSILRNIHDAPDPIIDDIITSIFKGKQTNEAYGLDNYSE